MNAVLLRTLTLKSCLWFGKYSGLSVQQILNLNKTGYLRNIYYAYEGISFTDDILIQIGVFGEKFDCRIKKPGTDLCLKEKLNAINFNKRVGIYHSPAIACNSGKSIKQIKRRNLEFYIKRKNQKSTLQWKNQGH